MDNISALSLNVTIPQGKAGLWGQGEGFIDLMQALMGMGGSPPEQTDPVLGTLPYAGFLFAPQQEAITAQFDMDVESVGIPSVANGQEDLLQLIALLTGEEDNDGFLRALVQYISENPEHHMPEEALNNTSDDLLLKLEKLLEALQPSNDEELPPELTPLLALFPALTVTAPVEFNTPAETETIGQAQGIKPAEIQTPQQTVQTVPETEPQTAAQQTQQTTPDAPAQPTAQATVQQAQQTTPDVPVQQTAQTTVQQTQQTIPDAPLQQTVKPPAETTVHDNAVVQATEQQYIAPAEMPESTAPANIGKTGGEEEQKIINNEPLINDIDGVTGVTLTEHQTVKSNTETAELSTQTVNTAPAQEQAAILQEVTPAADGPSVSQQAQPEQAANLQTAETTQAAAPPKPSRRPGATYANLIPSLRAARQLQAAPHTDKTVETLNVQEAADTPPDPAEAITAAAQAAADEAQTSEVKQAVAAVTPDGEAEQEVKAGDTPEAQAAPTVQTAQSAQQTEQSGDTRPPVRQALAQKIIDQIVQQTAQPQNGTTLQMELHPKMLGKIQLILQSTQDGITAKLKTENGTVRSLLNENLAELRDTLREAGINMKDIEITESRIGTNLAQSQNRREEQRPQRDSGGKMIRIQSFQTQPELIETNTYSLGRVSGGTGDTAFDYRA